MCFSLTLENKNIGGSIFRYFCELRTIILYSIQNIRKSILVPPLKYQYIQCSEVGGGFFVPLALVVQCMVKNECQH